jgi:protein-tyrosine phosphatase
MVNARSLALSRRRFLQTAAVAGAGLAFAPGCALLNVGKVPAKVEQHGAFLQIDGAFNLRDIGGYAVGDHSVVTGQLFRSGSLNRVSELGLRQLATLKLRYIVDFRVHEEALSREDRMPPGITVLSAPVPGVIPNAPPTGGLSAPDPATVDEFKAYVSAPDARASYGSALKALAAAPDRPMLWHCNSGTYRTGWASAVLLTLLGVAPDKVYENFLLSNDAFGATFAFPAYLDAAFAEATSEFGSFDAFLDRGLGIDAATQSSLRQALLA